MSNEDASIVISSAFTQKAQAIITEFKKIRDIAIAAAEASAQNGRKIAPEKKLSPEYIVHTIELMEIFFQDNPSLQQAAFNPNSTRSPFNAEVAGRNRENAGVIATRLKKIFAEIDAGVVTQKAWPIDVLGMVTAWETKHLPRVRAEQSPAV